MLSQTLVIASCVRLDRFYALNSSYRIIVIARSCEMLGINIFVKCGIMVICRAKLY